EHGDSEFPLWTSATVGTVPVQDFSMPKGTRLDAAAQKRIATEVVTAAERIIRGKGATNYAVGLAATRVIEAILRDENAVLPVSSLIQDEHSVSGVCLSLPSLVDANGVVGVLDVPMSVEEVRAFQESAAAVRDAARSVGL